MDSLSFMVEGIHCPHCVRRIEETLLARPGVLKARVNLSTRRLQVCWSRGKSDPQDFVDSLAAEGYRLVPFDPEILNSESERREKELLRAMAVAGFGAANVMLFSVSIWAGAAEDMGPATRNFLYWFSALIALPIVVYSGRPFFRSAFSGVMAGRINMDFPISLAVALAAAMSLWQTMTMEAHAYFDSALMLLFFLLIGRYLDQKTRGKARAQAERLIALTARAVSVIGEDGKIHSLPPAQVRIGMRVFVAAGANIPVDGIVLEGQSDVDTSLITGETMPRPVAPGEKIFAGTMNLSGPLTITVETVGEGTLLSEIVRLMENAEQGRAEYVQLADRAARFYAPLVHSLAAITFAGWMVFSDIGWQASILNAIAVLIITCPCALGLAVPVVQVVASTRLMRRGILLKSASALERLTMVDHIVFDKTGTLTRAMPELIRNETWQEEDLAAAACLAAASRHPLARALVRAAPTAVLASGVEEIPGCGLRQGDIRLGSRRWLGMDGNAGGTWSTGPELCFLRPGHAPVLFRFSDSLRMDAAETIFVLHKKGYALSLISGDRREAVERAAQQLSLTDVHAGMMPSDKVAFLQKLAAGGKRVLMVGDGLNDAPALSAALVSLSPSSAADISQMAADVVFQGDRLSPVIETLDTARRASRLVWQNFALAGIYNVLAVPLAMAGLITPLIAALAMSSSSLLVIGNALRLGTGRAMREA